MMRKSSFSDGIVVKIIIGVLAVAFFGLVIWAYINKMSEPVTDTYSYIDGNNDNGNIGDNIYGEKDAPVFIVEYADYQCPGCATTFPYIGEVVDEYDGQVSLIYRSFVLSYHKNGTAAASAADAAAMQGYWHEYASRLYENQSEWEYASVSQRDEFFKQYLLDVSDNKADTDKFIEDMRSDAVSKKVRNDINMAKAAGVDATPTIYVNGKKIDFSSATKDTFKKLLYDAIDEKLKEKGLESKRNTTDKDKKAEE